MSGLGTKGTFGNEMAQKGKFVALIRAQLLSYYQKLMAFLCLHNLFHFIFI
jgi:hypothetical protein